MTAETVNAPGVQADAPMQGPAAPTEADLLWATGQTKAVMDTPGRTLAQGEIAAAAEQAAYTAARHIGIDDPERDLYQLPELEAPEWEAGL